jgi:hypothetical protein
MRLPGVLSRLDLPLPELQAARLDGEVFALDECFCPIDEVEQQRHRAASLALLLPKRLIAEQHSAAWVYGAVPFAPQRHEICADTTARQRPTSLARFAVREVVIDATDIVELAGLRVTTPLRTVLDLARFSAQFTDDEIRIVGELLALSHFDFARCIGVLAARRNLPGKHRALGRLRRAAEGAQPPVTR